METTEKPKRPRGRPPKQVKPEKVAIPFDGATLQKIDALVNYGGFGTSRSEVAIFIIRLWLWDNQERLKADVSSKDNPFGLCPEQPR